MKKIILTVFALTLFSCNSDDLALDPNQPDCDCDRVVELNRFNIVGTPENPATVILTIYYTINDCTQVQKRKEHSTTNPNTSPQLGQCR